MRCLDCGNKAKKDCLYFRCRSCCRGHGFECQTHVKSTWAPVSTRQNVWNAAAAMDAASIAPPHHYHHQQEAQQLDPPSSFGFGGNFPSEVNGEATFTCVRVARSLEENRVVDQYAYETSISIGGRVFKGVLYDQGPSVNVGDHQNSTINNNHSNFQPVNIARPSVSSARPSQSHLID